MRKSVIVLGSFLGAPFIASTTNATQITSSDFSIGYGFSASASWNTSETASVNTDITGPFTLSINPLAFNYVGSGITFANRVPAEGGPGMFSAAGNDGSAPGTFRVPVTANYNGPAPIDASGTPNYQIQIEITSISIYAGANAPATTLSFTETTPGHNQMQGAGAALIDSGSNFTTAQASVASYTQLTWDPSDYSESIVAVNDLFVRTFSTDAPSTHVVFLDGLEITGRVHLFYDAVPEPSSLALVGLGGLCLLRRRHR